MEARNLSTTTHVAGLLLDFGRLQAPINHEERISIVSGSDERST